VRRFKSSGKAVLAAIGAALALPSASHAAPDFYDGKFRHDREGAVALRVADGRVKFEATGMPVGCDDGAGLRRESVTASGKLRGRHFDIEGGRVDGRHGADEYWRVVGHFRPNGRVVGYVRAFFMSYGDGYTLPDAPDCSTFGPARWLADRT
jgi:hypothetical protein